MGCAASSCSQSVNLLVLHQWNFCRAHSDRFLACDDCRSGIYQSKLEHYNINILIYRKMGKFLVMLIECFLVTFFINQQRLNSTIDFS